MKRGETSQINGISGVFGGGKPQTCGAVAPKWIRGEATAFYHGKCGVGRPAHNKHNRGGWLCGVGRPSHNKGGAFARVTAGAVWEYHSDR
jgi:hypothetical protein